MAHEPAKICRTCLAVDETLLPIYDNENINKVAEMLGQITNNTPHKLDGLPHLVCKHCLSEINHCFTFKMKCIDSESKLRELINTKNVQLAEHNLKFEVTECWERQESNVALDVKTENNDEASYFLISSLNPNSSIEQEMEINPIMESSNSSNIKEENESLNSYESQQSNVQGHQIKTQQENGNHNYCKETYCSKCNMPFSSKEFTQCQCKHTPPLSPSLKDDFPKPIENKDCQIKQESSVQISSIEVKCNECNKKFQNKYSLKRHMRSHSEQRPFICVECGKGYCDKSHYNTHLLTHQEDRPFKCEECSQTFNRISCLNRHLRIHSDERPFICEICNKGFRQLFTLNHHKRLHTGERPFACEFCTGKFKYPGTLREHMRTHTGEKPYKCEICQRGLSSKANYEIHMRSHAEKQSCEDEEEKRRKLELLEVRRNLRTKSNPLDLPDEKFNMYFRLNKKAFTYLVEEIKDKVPRYNRSSSVPLVLKIAATLRFLAEGGYQKELGNDFNLGLAQPTFSKTLREILSAIETHICPNWIKFIKTEEEKNEAKLNFFQQECIPGIIGCMSNIHVKIIAPVKEDHQLYLNKWRYYSLNVLAVCDHKMRIRFLDAEFPGSASNSFVWNSSQLRQILKQNFNEGDSTSWLLGDEGYPLEPFLITPYREAIEASNEYIFNQKHYNIRNIIKRTLGIMKNCFRCISHEKQLHYTPTKATQIINVCAALHNIRIHYDPDLSNTNVQERTDEEFKEIQEHCDAAEDDNDALFIRNQIMQSALNI